jgi:hypothetical protein
MRLSGQRALLIAGTALITVIAWALMMYAPMPHGLASPHAGIQELAAEGNCQRCHSAAGLSSGCLSCHTEIEEQLDKQRGYHAFLLKGKEVTCNGCHAEHAGPEFQLVSHRSWGAQVFRAFRHPHVEYTLEGKHSMLECEKCHEAKREGNFSLPGFATRPRMTSFLGLSQDCRACHEDRHSPDLTPICSTCHGQEAFKPTAKFDHAQHFPLIGGHEGRECKGCHVLPEPKTPARDFPFPFEKVRGTQCEQCHPKPHFAEGIERCEDCHHAPDPHWSLALKNVTTEKHAVTGFRLMGAHEKIECEKCHPRELPYIERYPSPATPGYLRTEDTCQGCHRDVHKGQFAERYQRCLDCHVRDHFLPSTIGQTAHAAHYELTGAHASVACTGCHKPDEGLGARKFAGTSKACKDCHAYPHGEQFRKEIAEGDCTVCHNPHTESFQIRPWDHREKTGYPLLGAHANALCNDCHIQWPDASGNQVRMYRDTNQECGTCHRDVHRGQFDKDGQTTCSTCHQSFESWGVLVFNHNTMSRFPLEGAHFHATCSRCHLPVRLPDGTSLIQYKPLGTECSSCHDIVPGSPTTPRR